MDKSEVGSRKSEEKKVRSWKSGVKRPKTEDLSLKTGVRKGMASVFIILFSP
jgi:hypothetical protein